MCQILLLRPGQTDFDSQNRILGSLDLPLNEQGMDEVERLATSLTETKIEIILTGPQDPAHSSATILGTKLETPVKVCDGLKNLDQGLWEGLEVEEVRRKYPSIFKHWCENPEEVSIPEGEPIEQVLKRLQKLLKKYTKSKQKILIVASDPLASLISCLIRGSKLCIQELTHADRKAAVEELQVAAKNGSS